MNISEAIKNRRSVRAYKDEPVPDEKLNKVLEAARMAPSARNLQNWKFIVVKDKDKRQQLAEAANGQSFISEAPVVIIAIGSNTDYKMRCDIPAHIVDLSIAVDHMTLQAVEEGLGTCWIGAFSQEKVKQVLEIPDEYKVVALLPLGYPSDSPTPKDRKSIKEIVSFEKF